MRLTMLGTGNANVTDYYNTCFLLTKETPEGPAHFLWMPEAATGS